MRVASKIKKISLQPSLHEIGLQKVDGQPICEKCDNDRAVLISCCSGAQCACLGLPIDAIFCPACNADGNIEPSDNIKSEWPFFFGDVAE